MRTLPVSFVVIVLGVMISCGGGDGDEDGVSASGSASATGVTAPTTAGSTGTDPSGSTGAGEASVGSEASADTTATATASASDSTTAADTTAGNDGSSGNAETTTDDVTDDAGSSSGGGLVDGGVLDVTIIAHDDCTFTAIPPSISVPEGTEFTVNWISSPSSDIEFDIAKIDQFNAVPIILGLEPGGSYHDEIRVWCGELFTGTFDFELRSCFDPTYIPVDCAA